jgi:hypothetical protein
MEQINRSWSVIMGYDKNVQSLIGTEPRRYNW